MVIEQLMLIFREKRDVCMIKLLLLCMLQLWFYAIQMQGCFKMAFVDVHGSCFGKHMHRLKSIVDVDTAPMNPYQPLPFNLILC